MSVLHWIAQHPWLFIGYLYAALNAANGLLPPKLDRVLSKIEIFLNRISLMRRGTLSIPGTNGGQLLPLQPSKDVVEKKKEGGFAAAEVLGVLAGLSLLGTIAGCCVFHGNCSGPTKVVVDCASAEVQQAEINLTAAVLAGLASSDWEAALAGLANQLGKDGMQIITCIVHHLLHPTEEGKLQATRMTSVQQGNAALWIQKHGAK